MTLEAPIRPAVSTVLLILLTILVATNKIGVAQEVRRVPVRNVELAYVEAGQGDPVVLVHGGLQDHLFWKVMLPRFAERYRVVAYSGPDHFPNPVAEDGVPDGAAHLQNDALVALVVTLGLDRVHPFPKQKNTNRVANKPCPTIGGCYGKK